MLAELATFPSRYPAMRNLALGENISTREKNMTHTFVVEFADRADLLDYLHSDRTRRSSASAGVR